MVGMHNNKRNKNTTDFSIGDIVSVLIPSIDRGHCDNKRLPCVVLETKQKSNHVLYILQSKYGILDHGYQVKEIEKYLGVLLIPGIETFPKNKEGNHEYPKISLRAAAALASNHTTDLALSKLMCNCSKACDSKYCVCFKAKQTCTSHCHNKLSSTVFLVLF